MRKVLLIFFAALSLGANAQEASVEKSLFGIQAGHGIIGPGGLWIHNELKISKSIALRTEAGFRAFFHSNSFYGTNGFLLIPDLAIEPRLYYNLDRRVSLTKNIANNSGSFVSLKIVYRPDWFVIPQANSENSQSHIFAAPTWGIRRNLGKHFNFEAAIGLGFGFQYIKEPVSQIFVQGRYPEPAFYLNQHLRIGYRF